MEFSSQMCRSMQQHNPYSGTPSSVSLMSWWSRNPILWHHQISLASWMLYQSGWSKRIISILLPFIVSIVNSSLNAGLFPPTLKEAILMPLIKKPNLDRNVLTNYRPVSHVPFLSKIIEKDALEQLKNHLDAFDLHDDFQSAYRKHHSTETALLRLKNGRSSRH